MSNRTVQAPLWFAIMIVAAALVVGGFAAQITKGGPVFTVAAAVPDNTRTEAGLQASFASVVRSATPSVVNIWSSKMVKTRGDEESAEKMLQDPFFRHFFGDMFG